MNLCAACGQDFGSLRSFDAHRVGSYATGRRCLSPEELPQHGFTVNGYGRWSLASEADRARRRFSTAGFARDGQRAEDVARGASAGGSDNPRTASELRALALVVLSVLEDAGVLTPLDALPCSREIRA
jgi:hypothetical protein